MPQNKDEQQHEIAPGIDNDEELNKRATKKDIKKDEYTNVTNLVWDEIEPSKP